MKTEDDKHRSADLIRNLASSDRHIVRKALAMLRQAGKSSDLPGILKAMALESNLELADEFAAFLADIHSKDAPGIIAGFLADPASSPVRQQLVRVCWESGLDYSPHLLIFAHLFITGDYSLAIEAFSVIENTLLERPANRQLVKEVSELVRNSIPDQPETKQRLVRELLLTIEPFITEG